MRICVFCGSSQGANPSYGESAAELGRLIANRGHGIVYGGGMIGLMGILADSALAAGGEVIGVIPEQLAIKEVAHEGLTELRVVDTMHARKALMAELSDAFIAMPGGFGTFEELCEIITWAQLGIHRKPCCLLNLAGFYNPLLALFDHATTERFIRPEHRSIVHVESDPLTLIDRLEALPALDIPPVTKWIDLENV